MCVSKLSSSHSSIGRSQASSSPTCRRDEIASQRVTPDSSLDAEIGRGQLLDRELARDLSRAEPRRTAIGASYVESLDRRPILAAAEERSLVRKAKEGDAAARARLVDAFMPLISSLARTYRSGQVHRAELL